MRNGSSPPQMPMFKGEILDEWSRERKLPPCDQQNVMASRHVEYGFSRRSSARQGPHGFQVKDFEAPAPLIGAQRYPGYRHRDNRDNSRHSASLEPNESISTEIRSGNSSYSSTGGLLQSPSTSFNMSAGKTRLPSNLHPSSYASFNQARAYESSSCGEVAGSSPHLQDSMRYGQRPLYSNYLPVGNLQRKSVEPQMPVFDTNKKLYPEGQNPSESSCMMGTGCVGTSNCFRNEESNALLQNEIQLRCTSSGTGLADADLTTNAAVIDRNAKIMKTEQGTDDARTMRGELKSDSQDLKPLSKAETLGTNVGADPNLRRHDPSKPSHDSVNADESCKSENGASVLVKKLWNGTLQLNANVKVSAVAYYKSGEKMPDMRWSNSLELKGKVRLDAFEKYIQDLSRSRNRGLMVMSLCCSESSSESGLAKSIKEVSRKYKEGRRIGLAQPVPGTDLYICPHSDTIITILAKYGFLKGKVAFEDNQDSWICCGVWRKNLTSTSDTKILKEKDESELGQPSSSPTNSSALHVTGNNSLPLATKLESYQVIPMEGQTTTEGAGLGSRQSKDIECSAIQADQGSSSSNASPDPSAFLSVNSSSIPSECTTIPEADVALLQKTIMQLSQINASVLQSIGLEKLVTQLEQLKPMLPLPSNSDAVKQPAPIFEDDDLPEYDFDTRVPQGPLTESLNAAGAMGKSPQAEGSKHSNGSEPWITDTAQVVPPSGQMGSQESALPRPPQSGHGAHGPVKRTRELELQNPNLREEHSLDNGPHAPSISAPTASGTKRKSLFDGDDMPEWCPPTYQLLGEQVAQAAGKLPASNSAEVQAPASKTWVPAEPTPHGSHRPATLANRETALRPATRYAHGGPSSREHTSRLVSRPRLDSHDSIYPTRWRR